MTDQKPTFIAQEDGDIIIVRMHGPINAETLPESRAMIDEMIESHGVLKRDNLSILVDYRSVTDVDSTTIANILERITEHKKLYHRIAFINVPEDFKSMIEIHKLQDKIEIFKSEKAALKELKKPTQ